jgi:hypothetical protein
MAIIWESNGVIMEKPTIFFGFNGSIFGGLISNPIHKPLGPRPFNWEVPFG